MEGVSCSKVERESESKKEAKELLMINNLRRLIGFFGGKLLLVNGKRVKSWAERWRSRMRIPIRWHVTSGNVTSEVPVGLYVSVKSVGVCDVVVLKDNALDGLFTGGRRHGACGAQSAFILLVFDVI
jgi:hypothetical protein